MNVERQLVLDIRSHHTKRSLSCLSMCPWDNQAQSVSGPCAESNCHVTNDVMLMCDVTVVTMQHILRHLPASQSE